MPQSGPLTAPEPAPDLEQRVTVTDMPRGNVGMPEDAHSSRTVRRDLPFLMDGDMLWVRNLGPKTLKWKWARKPYVIEPQDTQPVIFECCVNYLGDPRSVDAQQTRFELPPGVMLDKRANGGGRGIIMERYQELTRLMALYGIREERLRDFEKLDPDTGRLIEVIPGLLSRTPKVEVRTLANQIVRFPAQDPDMGSYPVASSTPHKVDSDVMRMFEALQAEVNELRGEKNRLEERLDTQYAAAAGVTDTHD